MLKPKLFKMVNVFISAIIVVSLFVNNSPIVAKASVPLNESYSAQDGVSSAYDDEFVEIFSYKSILQDMYDSQILNGN